jgi:zinc finger protein
MNRQLIRSSSCTISIPEYALTLPPTRGQLTTVEGLVREIIADLSADQPLRRALHPETWEKIEALLERLRAILGEEDDGEAGRGAEHDKPMPAFTVTLDDPAGNSFIEFVGSMADPKWNMRTYRRTKEDNITLGLAAPDDDAQDEAEGWDADRQDKEKDVRVDDEVHVFPGVCPSCGQPLDTLMKKVSIPYFKVRTPGSLSSLSC